MQNLVTVTIDGKQYELAAGIALAGGFLKPVVKRHTGQYYTRDVYGVKCYYVLAAVGDAGFAGSTNVVLIRLDVDLAPNFTRPFAVRDCSDISSEEWTCISNKNKDFVLVERPF